MAKITKRPDLIIIGGGTAGLTAALYAGQMNLDTLVLESELLGGQIINAAGVENYPGFASIKGSEFVAMLQQQAEKFGAVIDEFDQIQSVKLSEAEKTIETAEHVYYPKVVIIASGMTRRKLPLEEAQKFLGKGMHYCELCDGHKYQDKDIAVVGGGNAAVDAANFLVKYARKLYLIHRSPQLTANIISQARLRKNPAVEIILDTDVVGAEGTAALEGVILKNWQTGEKRNLRLDGIFINIGVVPNTQLFAGDIQLDEAGNIVAGEDCRTNIPGVFAAGDVRTKLVRQLTTAAADGTVAALLAEKYIRKLKEEK